MKDQKIDSRKLIQKKIKFYIELNLLPSQIIWNPLQTQTIINKKIDKQQNNPKKAFEPSQTMKL